MSVIGTAFGVPQSGSAELNALTWAHEDHSLQSLKTHSERLLADSQSLSVRSDAIAARAEERRPHWRAAAARALQLNRSRSEYF
jgi:hypothetical protein